MMTMFRHNGLWYLSVREHGRSRVHQLETRPPKITWKNGTVIEVGRAR